MKSIAIGVYAVIVVSALAAAQAIDPSALPAGYGRDVLFRVCGDCHGVETVTAERRTRAEWRGVVEDMSSRGEQATDDEIKKLIDYLSIHVGRVNVNRASADDLKGVLELTPEQASAIVAYRMKEGDFHTIDDLKKVPAIDARRIDERKGRIVFAGQ